MVSHCRAAAGVVLLFYGAFSEAVASCLQTALNEPDEYKVMELDEAVMKFIKPGDHIHFAHTYLRSNALLHSICRKFWNDSPDFTVSSLGFISNMVLIISGGLAGKIITSFCGDSYPFPGPNRVYQEAFSKGLLKIENWTVLTLTQRLLAGALGVDWMPTHSISGSSMEKENCADFATLDVDGVRTGFLRALKPDVAIMHAICADNAGNALMPPPYAENVYSAFAAKKAVIVSAEQIVSRNELLRYAHLVKIPSFVVSAVCKAPLGAHPGGASSVSAPFFQPYAEDEEFMLELRAACKEEESLREWTGKWLLECSDWSSYIGKLGYRRIWHLKGRAANDSWKSELAERASSIDSGSLATPAERMICAASRVLREKVYKNSYTSILAGIGASNLAAWKAWYEMRAGGNPVELMAEVGFYGYSPTPGDPFIFNFRNIPSCLMLTDILTVLGSMIGAKGSGCIGVLGAGQIDMHGNINSTKIPELNLFLVGSGGACDVANGAAECIVTCIQNKIRFVEEVPYVTAPGNRVSTVVSDRALFEKNTATGLLELTGIITSDEGERSESVIREIREKCSWNLTVSKSLRRLDPPYWDDLRTLRIFDPRGFFTAEAENL